jgi:predicted dinucleotide-binding enzyme
MDRISALRNVEDALSDLEAGETDLASAEERIVGVVRTFATDYAGDLAAYRASGAGAADGVVVVASSAQEAESRVRDLVDDPGEFAVEQLD